MIEEKWLFIAGCQRCATTSLLDFFSQCGNSYLPFSVRPERKPLLKESWQADILSHGVKGRVNIDKATSYIEYPMVSDIIRSNFTDYKVLISLRNPIDRALSNYFFSVENGIEDRSLEEALFSKEKKRYKAISVDPFNYVGRGFYYNYLRDFLINMSKEKYKIVVSEKFMKDEHYRDSISTWAGLDCNNAEFLHKNSAAKNHNHVSQEIRDRLAIIYQHENSKLIKEFDIDVGDWYA